MSTVTAIQWTDRSWNPIRGCSRVSEGCRNCYAELIAARFSGPGLAYEGLARRRSNGEPQWTGTTQFVEREITAPVRWRSPQRIFVNSMSDLFHETVTDESLYRIFGVMAASQYAREWPHTFQVLTKRPERMREFLQQLYTSDGRTQLAHAAVHLGYGDRYLEDPDPVHDAITFAKTPLPNVWLGVSVEHQDAANARIPVLLDTPAAVRFLSCEPLLGPVSLTRFLDPTGVSCIDVCPDDRLVEPRDYAVTVDNNPHCQHCGEVATWTGYDPGIDWVIVGGESGPGARPCDLAWLESLRTQCADAKVAFFCKQLGAVPMESEAVWSARPRTRLLRASNRNRVPDGFVPILCHARKGDDMAEWPESLRVREFPRGVR